LKGTEKNCGSWKKKNKPDGGKLGGWTVFEKFPLKIERVKESAERRGNSKTPFG